MKQIILATASPFRRALFERLQLPFECYSTDIDESPLEGETVLETTRRLALDKAKKAAEHFEEAICIGSDELGALHGAPLGKSASKDKAFEQLKAMSGQRVEFHTAISLYCQQNQHTETQVVTTAVVFQDLTDQMINRYLDKEKPYQSAASFKSESLGSALIERFEGDDPSAIIGLPLITVCQMLTRAGVAVL